MFARFISFSFSVKTLQKKRIFRARAISRKISENVILTYLLDELCQLIGRKIFNYENQDLPEQPSSNFILRFYYEFLSKIHMFN
jgi:hypothetical protein